jgi:hypothetical protein
MFCKQYYLRGCVTISLEVGTTTCILLWLNIHTISLYFQDLRDVQRSIGEKKRKQDVIAFVNTVTQFIHRGSYAHIVTVVRNENPIW